MVFQTPTVCSTDCSGEPAHSWASRHLVGKLPNRQMCVGSCTRLRASPGPKGKDVPLGSPEPSAAWQVSHVGLGSWSLCDTVTRLMDHSAQHNQLPHRRSWPPLSPLFLQIKLPLPRCVHPGSLTSNKGVEMIWWAASTGPGLGRGDSAPNVLKVCIERLMFTNTMPSVAIATSQLRATSWGWML